MPILLCWEFPVCCQTSPPNHNYQTPSNQEPKCQTDAVAFMFCYLLFVFWGSLMKILIYMKNRAFLKKFQHTKYFIYVFDSDPDLSSFINSDEKDRI